MPRRQMKGQTSLPEDIGWTIFVVIVVLFVAIMSLTMSLVTQLQYKVTGKGGILTYTLEFVNLASKPYFLLEALSFYQIDDRLFFEHALESAMVNSAEGASSHNMPLELKKFMDAYRFRYYFASIRSDKSAILSLDNTPKRCGDDTDNDGFRDGMCTSKLIGKATYCGIGSVEIDSRGVCGVLHVCCKQLSLPEYMASSESQAYKDLEITQCANGRGFCEVVQPRTNDAKEACGEAREYVIDDTCKDTNTFTVAGVTLLYKTPACCVAKSPQNLVDTDVTVSAEVPLLFNKTRHFSKDGGSIEVTIG